MTILKTVLLVTTKLLVIGMIAILTLAGVYWMLSFGAPGPEFIARQLDYSLGGPFEGEIVVLEDSSSFSLQDALYDYQIQFSERGAELLKAGLQRDGVAQNWNGCTYSRGRDSVQSALILSCTETANVFRLQIVH